MYRVEMETAQGETLTGKTIFGSLHSADTFAENLWFKYANTERYARFSVIDSSGNRVTDWEM